MKKLIGPIIFLAVAAVFAYLHWFGGKEAVTVPKIPDTVAVSAYVGGEKMNFLKNPEVETILIQRHGIRINPVKAGSVEMVSDLSPAGKDALWPGSQIAVEIFRSKGGQFLSEDNIFNSPLVLYAYDIVTDALIKAQIAEKRSETYYVVDFPKLIQLIMEGKKWADIGLPQLFGNIGIHTTDPTRSNSGNAFAGLIANMINGGNVVTAQTVDAVLPKVQAYFGQQGYMEHSSGDIFKNFITTGVGAKPIIVGYESQLVEFTIENEKYRDYLKQKIRTLYPVPTVWSSHPVIALTSAGKRFSDALKDVQLQKIAWEKHGFRSGLMGVENDPALLYAAGIPAEITSVIPMPAADMMEKIIRSLGE